MMNFKKKLIFQNTKSSSREMKTLVLIIFFLFAVQALCHSTKTNCTIISGRFVYSANNESTVFIFENKIVEYFDPWMKTDFKVVNQNEDWLFEAQGEPMKNVSCYIHNRHPLIISDHRLTNGGRFGVGVISILILMTLCIWYEIECGFRF